jgi:hypothetical protein
VVLWLAAGRSPGGSRQLRTLAWAWEDGALTIRKGRQQGMSLLRSPMAACPISTTKCTLPQLTLAPRDGSGCAEESSTVLDVCPCGMALHISSFPGLRTWLANLPLLTDPSMRCKHIAVHTYILVCKQATRLPRSVEPVPCSLLLAALRGATFSLSLRQSTAGASTSELPAHALVCGFQGPPTPN